MLTTPLGETRRARDSGFIATVVASGVGAMTEVLVMASAVSWDPVADKPPKMAPATATTTIAIEAAIKAGVIRGERMIRRDLIRPVFSMTNSSMPEPRKFPADLNANRTSKSSPISSALIMSQESSSSA